MRHLAQVNRDDDEANNVDVGNVTRRKQANEVLLSLRRMRFRIVSLSVDTQAAKIVQAVTFPDDHEVTIRIHGHGGIVLITRRAAVDEDFATDWRSRRVVTPRVDVAFRKALFP